MKLRRELALFAISGLLGFVIDSAIVQGLVSLFDENPYAARLLSFLCAATATWAFNRHFTFAGKRRYANRRAELTRYLIAMAGGFILNYGAYVIVLWLLPLARDWPVIGVAAGSAAGAVLNYLTSKFWIFRAHDNAN